MPLPIIAAYAFGTGFSCILGYFGFNYIKDKNIREEICLFQENWDALFTQNKNEMLKDFLKNSLLLKIKNTNKLIDDIIIYQNQLTIENGNNEILYLGSDSVRSRLLESFEDMRKFIFNKVICNIDLQKKIEKTPLEYLKDSREELVKCREGTGNLSKVIEYHVNGIDSILKNDVENRALISAMKDNPNTILKKYKDGYEILNKIIETYKNIEYLVTPINDSLIIKDYRGANEIKFGYFNLCHMGMFVSKFNSISSYIKAKYIYQDEKHNILRKHDLIFESEFNFTFCKDSTFRTILGFEEDIKSIKENEKYIIRFTNVKQIHDLEKLRANIKREKLNKIIECFKDFGVKFFGDSKL